MVLSECPRRVPVPACHQLETWYVFGTTEYAIGTIAAAAFGAILYGVVTGESIVGALTNIINRALNTRV